jgi:hypothetical protein
MYLAFRFLEKSWWTFFGLTLGIFLLQASIRGLILSNYLISKGILSEGVVIKSYKSGKSARIRVEFYTEDGKKHSFSIKGTADKGQIVGIRYDPKNPENVITNSDMQLWGNNYLGLFYGLGIIGFCGWILIKALKRYREILYLKSFGKSIFVVIDSVESQRNARNTIFFIYTHFIDLNGQKNILISDSLSKKPSKYLTGSTLPAFIDYYNPKKYWIDTEFLELH